MSVYIVTSDLHLTDNPLDEYRWQVFKHLRDLSAEYDATKILLLGDVTDRKDKHTSELVNRLVEEISNLPVETDILMGNHDMPIKGTPYLSVLNKVAAPVCYITKPTFFFSGLGFNYWMLPFSSNPSKDWKDLNYSKCHCLFMHQTMEGAAIDEDLSRVIPHDSNPMPKLPPEIPIISGDVHIPQYLLANKDRGMVTYVGAPHPVRFNETWENRILIIDTKSKDLVTSFIVPSIKRAILDLTTAKCLDAFPYKKGDQVKIRFHLNAARLPYWPEEEALIKTWVDTSGVTLVSTEVTLEEVVGGVSEVEAIASYSSKEIFNRFCSEEKVADSLKTFGQGIVEKVCSSL